jgi:hypothetical protein
MWHFKAMLKKIKAVWDMTPCRLQVDYPKDGESKLIHKVTNYLPVYTASHPR